MTRPWVSSRTSHSHGSAAYVRVNGKIRAREVRVIGEDDRQLGVIPIADALGMARAKSLDLVEIAPNANPPVCKLVDYGKYRYEQSKKEKESRKHQHANRMKEIQLRPAIDPHDLGVKLGHAIDFLCEDMKVKISLRFRGREMAHKEFGFQVVEKFLQDLAPYGHPDSSPKLIGRGLNVMISPLPRQKRAPNPHADHEPRPNTVQSKEPSHPSNTLSPQTEVPPSTSAPTETGSEFVNNPFTRMNLPDSGAAAS